MLSQRLQSILRTRRLKTTAARRAKKRELNRRQRHLVKPHGRDQRHCRRVQDPLPQAKSLHSSAKSRAARIKFKKSRSTSAKPFPTIDCRATKTTVKGRLSFPWFSRKASRINRRARARATAAPILFDVTTPSRNGCPLRPASSIQFASREPFASRRPSNLIRANSALGCNRL